MATGNTVLKIEGVSKQYRLGELGTGAISHDLNRWWHKVRGKEDPYLQIGAVNDRAEAGGDYVWALRDINFEVKQGQVLGIIGKNGAGKSTLLKILSQVTLPTTGSIKARGRIASLLEVGTGFHPELTGRENIFLNGTILGMTKSEIRSKLDEIIDFSGIAKYVDTPVKRYSSGMKVRLGFAVAAHLDPEILIVDEVLAVGDAEFQKKALGKMNDITEGQGRTILFVSHNMKSLEQLCQTGLLLENGRQVFEGNVKQVIDRYISGEYQDTKLESFFEEDEKLNEYAKLHYVKLTPFQNESEVYIKEDFEFEMMFEMMDAEQVSLSASFYLKDEEGNMVMNVGTGAIEHDYVDSYEKGKYYLKFQVKNNLGEGNYKLSIRINNRKSSSPLFKSEDILKFHVSYRNPLDRKIKRWLINPTYTLAQFKKTI